MASERVERVLDQLENVRPSGGGWSALCPAHDDQKNSLSVAEGRDGRVLLKCHAGCDFDEIRTALGLGKGQLSGKANEGPGTRKGKGLTLAQYAAAKKLPVDFLRKQGVGEVFLGGTVAVSMPYQNADGDVPAKRFRLSMDGEPRFRWKTGSKSSLYGLWRIERARKVGYLCLVEGESDVQTLWWHGFPALGLPGANTWQEAWAQHLEGIQRIYVVIEPDRGGEAVQAWLGKSAIRDRVRLVLLDGVKDPSELHLRDPENFGRAWKAMMRRAVPWVAKEKEEKRAKQKAAWAECEDLAREEDILAVFARAVRQRGVIGEDRACKLLYLMLTSRLLEHPVSGVATGPSSGGKSFVVRGVLDFFPGSAYYALTAMSEHALAYSTEPLSHRFLVLYEGAALKGDFVNYILRSLLSEGRLRYETVEKTAAGGLKPRLIEREGPTGLVMTTTAIKLHPELTTRYLEIPISDSQSQTTRILREQARTACSGDGERSELSQQGAWHAIQEWLTVAEHRVRIPYATTVAELVPPVAVRLRRDFRAILQLVKTHAMLHQANRGRDQDGQIVARLVDYRAVRDLVNDLISEGVEQAVSPTLRDTVSAVERICQEYEQGRTSQEYRQGRQAPVTAAVAQVAEELQMDRSSALRRVKKCVSCGYLENLEKQRGRPYRIALGDPMPAEAQVMPTAREVLKLWKARQRGAQARGTWG